MRRLILSLAFLLASAMVFGERVRVEKLSRVPEGEFTLRVENARAVKEMLAAGPGLLAFRGRLRSVSVVAREAVSGEVYCHGLASRAGERLPITKGLTVNVLDAQTINEMNWFLILSDGSGLVCYRTGGGELTLTAVQQSLKGILKIENGSPNAS